MWLACDGMNERLDCWSIISSTTEFVELDIREEIYINFIESGRYTERLRKGSRIVDAETMNE